ncbi:MAG: hypothetical protein Q4F81_10545 [Eubacteriales bacterium]|nr:hypothetical protein [Eubacteriales bacterium]
MTFDLADWRVQVDLDATRRHTRENASDHCECAYCRNFYETLQLSYPGLCVALSRLGIDPMGPSELMPFTPTLYLACYRLKGRILRWGRSELAVGGIPIVLEAGEEGSFFLWVGELELPWVQQEPGSEVTSPANLPEFLERMKRMWELRHGQEFVCS